MSYQLSAIPKAKLEKETEIDKIHLARALALAQFGAGLVSPNPLVGCVVVSKDDEAVGEGSYNYHDIIHAEAIALQQAGEKARGGTAYVSLEPHSHFGKTPPCTQALIDAGIARVVCPIEDPNPLVSGRGFARLREAGIEVRTGLLAGEASRQNEKFICWHKHGRPFVHLKLAMSLDARISKQRGMATRLTGDEAMGRAHELRHEHDAILIGGNTAEIDDPSLTDRSGRPRRRPLVRVVLDNSLRLNPDSRLPQTAPGWPTKVFSSSDDESRVGTLASKGVDIVGIDARDLPSVLAHLKENEIQSVLVEGGGEIAGSFLAAKLVDKLTFIYAPIVVGGEDAPAAIAGAQIETRLTDVTVTRLGADVDVTGYPKY